MAAEQQHPLDHLLPEFASFMDVVKQDFTERGLWTEYDQGLRDRITEYHLRKLALRNAVGDPRHSMQPTEAQITAALAAACLLDTPESRKDMRKALIAASPLRGDEAQEGGAKK